MSRTLNKVMLIGNVGKDPEVNFTPSGVKVTQFRLATSESWKDKDGAIQEHTDWHTVIAWRGLADIVEKLVKKGSRVYVEGKIQSRTFEDREGNKRYVTEIVADNLLLLDARRTEHNGEHVAGNGGHAIESGGHAIESGGHAAGNGEHENGSITSHVSENGRDEIPF